VRRVYLVDDSALIRERLVDMLADIAGVRVIGQSADPREALTAIRLLSPDTVILDIHLPGKSGIELLKEIKREAPATRVIVFTNSALPQYRKQCLEHGAEHFLSKAREFEELRALFKRLDGLEHHGQEVPRRR
jgi:DNA-binding NarL/FixJ family response regulator